MLETFLISFRLRNTYKTNSFLWSLKSLPLIKRFLPSSLYASPGLKIFANVVSGIREFISVFLGKAIYLLGICMLTMYGMKTTPADSFAHILIFLTLIGGILNTHIFNPTKDKYYAMFIMRMDAKMYTLTDYIYFLVKMLLGFWPFSFLMGSICGASVWTGLSIPVYVICVKLLYTALSLARNKRNESINENSLTKIKGIAIAALLLAAALPYMGYSLNEIVLWCLTGLLLVPSIFAIRYILRFDAYRGIYKKLLQPDNIFFVSPANASTTAQQKMMQKKISTDLSQTSNKSGYQYFNEIFMKRHSKLLTKSTKRITIVAFLILVVTVMIVYFVPESRSEINKMMMTYLPYFLFVMYIINRGRAITQAMFMNCDHSMLTFRFYRQPKDLLSLFVERLKYLILINLTPALVIALGLPLLLYMTGGTEKPINYLLLIVSIIAMSIFFSVHNLVLYYLLQPYNINLESKSMTYSVINWITYMICYLAIQIKMPTIIFGSVISIFCIIYVVVALILAYRLAPRSFKLRE